MGDGRLLVPDDKVRAACPTYDDWHFGTSAKLVPYVATTPGGVSAALKRFARRDVVYMQGHNDTCDCNPGDAGCGCVSHGLEVTCSDMLMGRYRLERGRLYFAQLQAYFNASGNKDKQVHELREVANVGHDHSQMWQSPVGLASIFN